MKSWVWIVAGALVGTLPPSGIGSAQPQAPSQGGLPPHLHAPADVYMTYRALVEGGAVIILRHGKTRMTGRDAYPVDLADCDKQRGLSPAGVEASREMGEAFRLLEIPVGRVLASPCCRTRETAKVAFGRVESEPELRVGPGESGWPMDRAGEALERLAAVPPAGGVNTVLVAHVFNAMHAFGVQLEEGEALIVKPDGHGGSRVVGRITSTQWGDLARDSLTFGDKVVEMAARGPGSAPAHGVGGHQPGGVGHHGDTGSHGGGGHRQ